MRKLLLAGLALLFVMAGAYPQQTLTSVAKKPKAPEIEVPSASSTIILLGGTALVIRGCRKKSTI